MGKWEMVRLGDLCENKISTLPAGFNDKIVYIDISSIDNDIKEIVSYQEINGKVAPSRAKQILEENDIIISTVRPNLNAVATNTVNSQNIVVASTGYCILRCKKTVDIKYIFQFCQSKRFISALIKVAKGASYPAVSNNDVKNAEIPLPPIDEQKRIAKNLDLASEIVKGYKEQLAELDKLVQSVFYEMFGDPVNNEKGWAIKYIDELYEIIDGDRGTNYPKQEDFSDEGYCLFLNAGNVTKKGFVFEIVQFITKRKDELLRKGKLQRDDIVLTTRGTVGNLAHYTENIPFDNVRINSGMVILRRFAEVEHNYFLKYFSNPLIYTSLMSGSAQPQLPITSMRKAKVLFPPIPLQTHFASIAAEIETQKAQVQEALTEAENLLNSLMQEYFD